MRLDFRVCKCLILMTAAIHPIFGVSAANAAEKTVRVAVVNTPYFSGLLKFLLTGFEKSSGYRVEFHSGNDVFDRARGGLADIVIAHYGKMGTKMFVLDGYGGWPKTVFANQAALIGPKNDPAKIRGLADATEAFRRIARTKSPFVANNLHGITYLTKILWEAAGRPKKDAWFIDTGARKGKAIGLAQRKNGYVIWGAYPFLRYKARHKSGLEILVGADPIFHRLMVSIVVLPGKVSGVNAEGAKSLQRYLLSPGIQAKIVTFRSPGWTGQLWWPAGRSNNSKWYSE